MKQSEPLKNGFVVTETDGQPWDLPVRLRFPKDSLTRTWDNTFDVEFSEGDWNRILIAPNGLRWRLSVNDDGSLETTRVDEQGSPIGLLLALTYA